MVENSLVRNSAPYAVKAEGWGSWESRSHELRSESAQHATKAYLFADFSHPPKMPLDLETSEELSERTAIVSRCCLHQLRGQVSSMSTKEVSKTDRHTVS